MKPKLLFVCSMARLRSRTAAQVLRDDGFETRFAGLAADADRPLMQDDLLWADEIFCFEAWHFDQIKESLDEVRPGIPLSCMFIPDDFDFMDPALINAIRAFFRMREWDRQARMA